jgi:hypothetical protein
MEKKKKPVKHQAHKTPEPEAAPDTDRDPPVVQQVVEVVEEEKETVQPRDTAAVEDYAVEDLKTESQSDTSEINAETDDSNSDTASGEVSPEDKLPDGDEAGQDHELKQRQVVEELFSKHEPDSLTEISIHHKKPGRSPFIWAIVVLVAALTTGAGLLFFSGNVSIGSVMPAKPTPEPTAEPTQAPVVSQLNREDLKVQVLNGGGVAGAASKMKEFLTEKGYQVTDVGNTEDYSYDLTEIVVKSGADGVIALLEEDLEEEYEIGSTSAILDEDALYDVRVIVGKK